MNSEGSLYLAAILAILAAVYAIVKFCHRKETNPFLKLVVTIENEKTQQFRVYDSIARATFRQIFESLPSNLENLCLTPAEREKFCRENFDWLSPNGSTFFLEKRGDDFFVVGVCIYNRDSHDLSSFVCNFESDRQRGGDTDRVVVRKQ